MNKENHASRKLATMAVCVLTLVSAAGGEERKLTLPEAVDLALHQNHAVKIAHYGVAAELQKKRGAQSSYYPTLTNESNAIYVTELQRVQVPAGAWGAPPATGPIPASTVFLTQGNNAFQTSGTTLAQPLTQLIKIHAANKVAAADVGISQASLRKTSTDVVYSVHELYYRLLSTQLQRRAAELQITSSNETLAESREQYKNGSLLQVAVVESRANSLEAKQTLLTTDMQLSDLTVELNDVLGLPLDTKLVLDPQVDTAFDVPPREESFTKALKDNPEVQEAVQQLAKARAAEAAAKAEYIPNITGFARHRYQNGVPFVERNYGVFGVEFSYDVFEGGKRRALVRERQDEVLEAEENLERTKEAVGVNIATIYNKLETTRAMVDVAREYLAARQENAGLNEDQFKQGALLASQRDASRAQAMKAQAGLLEASLGYLLARDELTRTLGSTAP